MITLILLCVYISVVVSDIPFWSSGHNDDDVTRYFKINIPRRMRHDSHTVHSVYEPARLSVVSLVAWSDDEASSSGWWSGFNALLSAQIRNDHMVKCNVRVGSHTSSNSSSGNGNRSESFLRVSSYGCETNLDQMITSFVTGINDRGTGTLPRIPVGSLFDVLLLPASLLLHHQGSVDGLTLVRWLSAVSGSVALVLDGPAVTLSPDLVTVVLPGSCLYFLGADMADPVAPSCACCRRLTLPLTTHFLEKSSAVLGVGSPTAGRELRTALYYMNTVSAALRQLRTRSSEGGYAQENSRVDRLLMTVDVASVRVLSSLEYLAGQVASLYGQSEGADADLKLHCRTPYGWDVLDIRHGLVELLAALQLWESGPKRQEFMTYLSEQHGSYFVLAIPRTAFLAVGPGCSGDGTGTDPAAKVSAANPEPLRVHRSFVGPYGSVRDNRCLSVCIAFANTRSDGGDDAVADCQCSRLISTQSGTESRVNTLSGAQWVRQWSFYNELLPASPIVFHEDLYLSYKSSIAGFRDQYSIMQIWRDSRRSSGGSVVADASNWKDVMHQLSLYIDRIDSFYAFAILSRGITRRKHWLPNELAASKDGRHQSYGHWIFNTRYIALEREKGKTAVPRVGVPFGMIVETLSEHDSGLYRYWAMAVSGVRHGFTPLAQTSSSIFEILNQIHQQFQGPDQSINSWWTTDSVVSGVENDDSAQTTQYFAHDAALPNIAAVFSVMPDDDPGQVLLTLLNQYELSGGALPSIAHQIGNQLLPPSSVGSPVRVLARRQAGSRFLMAAIAEEIELSNTHAARRRQVELDITGVQHSFGAFEPGYVSGGSLGYIFGDGNQMERFIEQLPSVGGGEEPSLAQTCGYSDINAQLLGEDNDLRESPGDRENGQEAAMFSFSDDDAVTLGMTTCKRLDTFRATMAALMPAIGYYRYSVTNSSGSFSVRSLNGSLYGFTKEGAGTGVPSDSTMTRQFVLYRFVKEVVIVDDSSSDADRAEMLRLYGDFTFVMKAHSQRGHASSLNMLMAHVKTRYFIYLEDDWKLLPIPYVAKDLFRAFKGFSGAFSRQTGDHDALDGALLPPVSSGIHISYFGIGVLAGISIMKQSLLTEHTVSDIDANADISTRANAHSGASGTKQMHSRGFKEPIAQVLFNDQVSDCTARGFVYYPPTHPLYQRYHCKKSGSLTADGMDGVDDMLWNIGYANPEVGFGGWARTVGVKLRTDSRSMSDVDIPYSIHEFGLASNVEVYGDRIHQHSTWPGFSLNPGVWDLHQIRGAFNRCISRSHRGRRHLAAGSDARVGVPLFDENDKSFEHEWSILAHSLGLTTSFFGASYFEHTGERVSAYVLNNYTRIWDNNRSALLEMDYFWGKGKLFDD